MRRPVSSALVGALVALLATPALAAAQTADRIPVIPEGQRASPTLTPGIRSGNIVYASGQLGNSRADTAPTIQSETRRALENTKRVFEAAGTTMANTIRCTVFLVDVKDFAGMNEAYREFFPTSPPARSTVVVAALVVPNAKVEIECMAAIPPK
jgi:2-iminobutanoate/2-iminopropanoate deaminase